MGKILHNFYVRYLFCYCVIGIMGVNVFYDALVSLYGTNATLPFWISELSKIFAVAFAAFATGYIYGQDKKQKPDKRDVRRFALTCIALALALFIVHRALLAYVGAPVFEDPAAAAWVEKELGITAPKALTFGFYIFLPIYYLFYYGLVAFFFSKGASTFIAYLEKKNAEKGV